jgi:Fic family protein
MRRIERPPIVSNKWDFGALLAEMPVGMLAEVKKKLESDYPYWEKWKSFAKSWDFDGKKLWCVIKTLRGLSGKIDFSGIKDVPMSVNTPSVMQQLLHELDMDLGENLQAGSLIPAEEKTFYLVSSLMEEAIASSQLEGAATTRKVAKEMLESQRKPVNLSEQMIANNYAVMQWIVQNKDKKITPASILTIHRLITGKTMPDDNEMGAFRTKDDVHVVDVQTGAVVHTPPSHKLLNELMRDFCAFANDETKQNFFVHPISRGIIIHFLVGFIHPFADGNGRTGRALFYWYLMKKGYWLIEYMSISRVILNSRAQYARAYQYTELDDMDLTYFVLYNLHAISQALKDLKKYIQKKSLERQQILSLLHNTDLNDWQLNILQEIINEQASFFSVLLIESKFGISNQTARNDLNTLVRKGILQTRKSGKQIQFFPVKDAIRKIKKMSGR